MYFSTPPHVPNDAHFEKSPDFFKMPYITSLLRPLMWSIIFIMMVLSIAYTLYSIVESVREDAQETESLKQKLTESQKLHHHILSIQKDEGVQKFMPRLEILMEPDDIYAWCRNIPKNLGLSPHSPLLKMTCHEIEETQAKFTPLFNILYKHLSQSDAAFDAHHLYQPVQFRLFIESYTEALFFQVLKILNDQAPFYMEIDQYTLKRIDAPNIPPPQRSLLESVQERDAPIFQGVIDISAIGLWGENEMNEHEAREHDMNEPT